MLGNHDRTSSWRLPIKNLSREEQPATAEETSTSATVAENVPTTQKDSSGPAAVAESEPINEESTAPPLIAGTKRLTESRSPILRNPLRSPMIQNQRRRCKHHLRRRRKALLRSPNARRRKSRWWLPGASARRTIPRRLTASRTTPSGPNRCRACTSARRRPNLSERLPTENGFCPSQTAAGGLSCRRRRATGIRQSLPNELSASRSAAISNERSRAA